MNKSKNNCACKLRYKYWFDNTMGRGASALITGLAIITVIIVLLAGVFVLIVDVAPEGEDKLGFFEAMWRSLMRTLDAGTMGGDAGWGYRAVMFVVTLGGIFIVSALIGVINNAISNKLEELRKGRSFVVENNHTLILGWSDKIFSIISELVIANENQKHPRIVILAEKDKVEMEDEIKSKIPITKNTKVICRNGNCMDLDDLKIVNPSSAKSIIILANEGKNSDISIIKTVLAITNNPLRKQEPYHIVSEMGHIKNLRIAEMVAKGEGIFILNNDIISRMIVQTCRQSGLSVVFTELLDFDGDEIYFAEVPALSGKTFGEILNVFDSSSVIGIFPKGGTPKINPPMDTVINAGDQIIAISKDDDTIVISGKTNIEIDESAIITGERGKSGPERTLVLGWNEEGITIVKELDNYVAPGSFVKIVADLKENTAGTIMQDLRTQIKNQTIEMVCGNTIDRDLLDSLDAPSFNHIIVLCYNEMDSQDADSLTLVTLLHLRDIEEKTGKDFSIVSEMLDIKNRQLAAVTSVDDFIVSNKIISLMMAQLSENKHLKPVFDNLFDAEGSEIYLKPVTDFVEPGRLLDFHTVVKSALMKNEIAIGYRQFNYAGNADKAYGVVVNPDKNEKITFEPTDKIIVIAED